MMKKYLLSTALVLSAFGLFAQDHGVCGADHVLQEQLQGSIYSNEELTRAVSGLRASVRNLEIYVEDLQLQLQPKESETQHFGVHTPRDNQTPTDLLAGWYDSSNS